jgi:hypothetical protein
LPGRRRDRKKKIGFHLSSAVYVASISAVGNTLRVTIAATVLESLFASVNRDHVNEERPKIRVSVRKCHGSSIGATMFFCFERGNW